MRLELAMARAISRKMAKGAANPARPVSAHGGAHGLRDGANDVDGLPADKGQDDAGAENEHQRDDGGGDHDGLAHGARGAAAFARHDGDIFEAAQGADGHLAEDGEAEEVGFGPLPGDGIEMMQGTAPQRPDGERQQNGVSQQDHDAAGVVQPFAEVESADGDQGDGGQHHSGDGEGGGLAAGHPGAGGPEHVRNVGGDLENDGAHAHYGVHPEVPGGEEAGHFAEAGFGPLIEAAFERHEAIEMDDDGGQGQVEHEHGREPEDHVGAAQFGGDADPGRADDAEHLGEHQVAESHFLA